MSDSDLPQTRMRRAGQVTFAALFVDASALLLAMIGQQTAWVDNTDVVAQPRFWPAVALSMMTGFGLLHLWHLSRRRINRADERREVARWLRPLEHAAWFMVFVWAVPIIGFLPAGLIFAPAMTWRLGYRAPRFYVAAVLFVVVVVVLFKGILSVRIPGGALYDHLPGVLRNFAIVWL